MHTQQILKDELGVATRVMTICPVGENKVTFATLKKHIDYEVPQTQARAYSEEESLLWMYSWLFKASAGGQRLEKKQISMPE